MASSTPLSDHHRKLAKRLKASVTRRRPLRRVPFEVGLDGKVGVAKASGAPERADSSPPTLLFKNRVRAEAEAAWRRRGSPTVLSGDRSSSWASTPPRAPLRAEAPPAQAAGAPKRKRRPADAPFVFYGASSCANWPSELAAAFQLEAQATANTPLAPSTLRTAALATRIVGAGWCQGQARHPGADGRRRGGGARASACTTRSRRRTRRTRPRPLTARRSARATKGVPQDAIIEQAERLDAARAADQRLLPDHAESLGDPVRRLPAQ